MADTESTPIASPELGFTAKWLSGPGAKLPPDTELGDMHPAGRGLRARWMRSGGITFRWYTVLDTGKRAVVTIGPWSESGRLGHVTIAQARKWVRDLKEAKSDGRLDAALGSLNAFLNEGKSTPAHKKAAESGSKVRDVAELWFQSEIAPVFDAKGHRVSGRKFPQPVRRALDESILPAIGDRAIIDVDELALGRIVDSITGKASRLSGAPPRAWAKTVLAYIKQFFGWAKGRGYFTVEGRRYDNPAASLSAKTFRLRASRRTRVAEPEEIRSIWNIQTDSSPNGRRPHDVTVAALRLELLLGCRTQELRLNKVANLDYDKATLTVPVEIQKHTSLDGVGSARPWVIPLPPLAVTLLRQLDQIRPKGSPWLLWSPLEPQHSGAAAKRSARVGDEPLSDGALNALLRRAIQGGRIDGEARGKITPHDLRRTFRTNISKWAPRDVAERCLNHALPDMEAVYNQYDFLPQRRAALEKWADEVMKIVHPDGGGSVVPLVRSLA